MWSILIACFGAALGYFLLVMIWDCNRFVVRSYQVASPKLEKKHRVVLISDLHNKVYGKDNEKVLQTIRAKQPDFVLIAGDMITASQGERTAHALHFLKALSRICPVYYGLGNHEHKLKVCDEDGHWQAYHEAVKAMGVQVLDNEHLRVAQDIEIYGLTIEKNYYKRLASVVMPVSYLEKTIGRGNQAAFQILLAHHPDYFDAYAQWGADLTVSGHVHGGIMRLPFLGGVISPSLRLFPKYDGGYFQKGGRTMVVSRGLGTHTLPIRIWNPGELAVIDLLPVSSKA